MAISEGAVLGSIGRKSVCFGLADQHGVLRAETIRSYAADAITGVSAALTGFQHDLKLARLPSQSAIAVPGLVRGDTVSITNTRWFLSRSGLHAMLGEPPLILNDFAAEAWGLSGSEPRMMETFGGPVRPAPSNPGCYLVMGITSGLGVAAITKSQSGMMAVLPTEAGHGAFADTTEELVQIAAEMSAGRRPVVAEDIISAPGLVAIYGHLLRRAGLGPRTVTPEQITGMAPTDPTAHAACDLLAKAFWAQAGGLAMTFGAWDGILITGKVACAIRSFLRKPEALSLFATSAKHRRVLESVPRALVSLEDCELLGAAEALRHERVSGSLNERHTH